MATGVIICWVLQVVVSVVWFSTFTLEGDNSDAARVVCSTIGTVSSCLKAVLLKIDGKRHSTIQQALVKGWGFAWKKLQYSRLRNASGWSYGIESPLFFLKLIWYAYYADLNGTDGSNRGANDGNSATQYVQSETRQTGADLDGTDRCGGSPNGGIGHQDDRQLSIEPSIDDQLKSISLIHS